jgi:hypothetical protein
VFVASSCLTISCARHAGTPALAVSPAPGTEIVVPEAPPRLKHEVIPAPTSADQVWIPGFWMSNQGRWMWVPGRYELRPRPGAEYEFGRWTTTDRGYVYIPGHWR